MSSRLVIAAALISTLAVAADPKTPEFIKPYPGQKLYGEVQSKDFDEVYVLSGKVKAEPPSAGWQKLEGKTMQWHYDMPEGRSSLEVFKNYEQALKAAGFETVFACAEATCGDYSGPVQTWQGAANSFVQSKSRYTLTKLNRAEGTVWAAVYITQVGLALTKVIVVEEKAMDTGMVKVDAAALKKGLEDNGFIAVYGIEFDTGKATLKPSSSAAFEEVKKLLDGSPELKLYVVGHTDDVGQESANVALSNSRAAAVVQELTTKYKVAKNRLKSAGVGPYSPVASNRSEAGRAKNRRVVLVEDVP
jgi:outer membrane protein OmpA-like peptidoglycan-associated protein